MIENTLKYKHLLILWLFTGCFLVFGMVVVGGITRLTGSGLSITEWKVITGAIPPLNDAQWNIEFEKYKQIPQYKSVNAHFTLSDFKFIYFWEYIHRLFGRMIGVVFLTGFLFFFFKKAIPAGLMSKLLFMFVLGGIQGFLGWYMVASGLTQNIRVSHIRLAIHLTFAFITFGYIFKVGIAQLFNKPANNANSLSSFRKPLLFILVVLTFQVVYGAFVAGTKAGWTYNTWPTMNGEWVPESLSFALGKEGVLSFIYNVASIQFIHRGLAYLLTLLIVLFAMKLNKMKLMSGQKMALRFLVSGVLLQVMLGIVTLLLQVPLWLGVVHQALAFFLFAGVIYMFHRLSYA